MWYGPDTYMGRNLAQLFASLAGCSDEEVRQLHPQHTADSVRWVRGGGRGRGGMKEQGRGGGGGARVDGAHGQRAGAQDCEAAL